MQFKDIRFHRQLREAFARMAGAGRFPHTVLLEGADGYGTLPVAVGAAASLLCGDDPACRDKVFRLAHPDVHYVFPTVPHPKEGASTTSRHYGEEWQAFVKDNPFGTYEEWMNRLDAGNKQGMIRVQDAAWITREAHRYPVAGDRKVFIVWHAEKMNTGTANKLLKLLEEPPEGTYFLLLTPAPLQILSTIRSRAQHFRVPPVPASAMREALAASGADSARIEQAVQAASGDWNKAWGMVRGSDPFALHKDYFVRWVRIAYSAKRNPSAVNRLAEWTAAISGESRNFQMEFLRFALETVRRSYLNRFGAELPYFDFDAQGFRQEKFTPFVHTGNIEGFYRELGDAVYHLARNANPKTTFMDLSIRLTRLLHAPTQ
ncbi:MAG: DNA polymerase III subunit delta' [Chlorobi bacterium]|nr:DNA polymerase III subunit delta' [Chlorobiota bacterium]